MYGKLSNRPWYDYLEEDLQELLNESFDLLETVPDWHESFHDYSFIVFPAAKSYEGFLKKLFLDMGFITSEDYYGSRFRIGKALNPQLEAFLRKESIYDKLVEYCKGKELADKLWDTWRNCRNLVFHWFPDEKNAVTFDEARGKVESIIDAIDAAFKECRINYGK